jgi:hypothetical protein
MMILTEQILVDDIKFFADKLKTATAFESERYSRIIKMLVEQLVAIRNMQ